MRIGGLLISRKPKRLGEGWPTRPDDDRPQGAKVRKVLVGSVDVYGWEDEDGLVKTDLDELHGQVIYTSGWRTLLVREECSGAELDEILKRLDEPVVA